MKTEWKFKVADVKYNALRKIIRVYDKPDHFVEVDGTMEEAVYLNKLIDKVVCLSIEPVKGKRSLTANAYFHVLCREIAQAITSPEPFVKNKLLHDYGCPELTEQGENVTMISNIPEEEMMNRSDIHCFPASITLKGETVYNVYRGSHTYNTAEMSNLIDGTIAEALGLGLVVKPDKEIEKMKAKWKPD